MKVLIAIALTLQATIAAASCFENTQCVPYNESADANISPTEMRQRGTLCLSEAEELRARRGSRHACFRPLDSMGISYFNKASVREFDLEQQAHQAIVEASNEQYLREQQEYEREMERYNRERAQWERECAAYRAATGRNCQ
jgi:hypothetical protein